MGETRDGLTRQADDYGEKWFSDPSTFEENLVSVWGRRWSVSSEVGKLRAVLLRRPGREIEIVKNPADWRWKDVMDPAKARDQHDAMAEIYRSAGVDVFYVEEQREDRPNAIFMRDNVLGTPEGAIVCRQATAFRRGEEKAVALALAKIGCPIVRTISGRGIFEGACGLWIDRETVVLGTGVRSNEEGVRQVTDVLQAMGVVNILRFQIPWGHAHLDGLMNPVDKKKLLIFPWQVPYDVVDALIRRGFQIIEAPSLEEVKYGSAVNLVALEPGRVVAAKGNSKTKAVLEQNGVEVIEAEVDELMKGFGCLHCMTAFLERDPI
ncbi:MAG: amidinotransferase [Synergistaceae bacterium]|jgi:N-dimethylarginine dimethylaminohydrolase|nr:amidinotransferase [Synergistaceae bacterium]